VAQSQQKAICIMQLPDFLEAYTLQSQEYLDKGLIEDITFSGPTYQVEIQDLKTLESVWVFLQLGDDRVNDVFCSCEESAQKGACAHMAAACQFVFSRNKDPLHSRFQRSLWHELFLHMQKECSLKPPKVSKEGDQYVVKTHSGDLLFSAIGTKNAKERLKTLLTEKEVETEETSIKFSNLTEEELTMYRQGRPSLQLRFELSFLSGVAKWLFLMQEKGIKYEVVFEESEKEKLPKKLEIRFNELTVHVPLSDETLQAIIPSLQSVKSNLVVYPGQEALLESVTYDIKTGNFEEYFTTQEKDLKKKFEKAFRFGKWLYIPNLGFYNDAQKVSPKLTLSNPEEISSFLENCLSIIKKQLKNIQFHEEPRKLKYELRFDKNFDIHIEAYLFEPHDLTKATSHNYGDWVYVDGKGFFKVEMPKFSSVHTVITKDELSSFLMQNRIWLSNFEGFEVFVTKVEDEISYEVDERGSLFFQQIVKKEFSKEKTVDLGDWIYRKGFGFYLKQPKDELKALPVKKPIPLHLVSEFIRSHLPVMQNIPNFFATECPISQVGLIITLKNKGVIEIVPHYSWVDKSDEAKALFYDEYVFVRDKGFYCLPPHLRPLHYTREIESQDTDHWNAFFLELLPKLKAEFVCKVDPRLEPVDTLSLVASPSKMGPPSKKGVSSKKEEIQHDDAFFEHELDLHFRSKTIRITLPDVINSLTRGERFLPTEAGCIDLAKDRFHWLKAMEKKRSAKDKKASTFKLTPIDFFRLQAYEDVIIDAPKEQKAILERLLELKPAEPPVYPDFKCDLRPYQQNGVAWLWFLYRNALSGLLCDDMGVGKTHQAMGLMASIYHFNKAIDKKSLFLVICPTSLIFHWEDKLKRFMPNFRVKTYVGSNRTIDDFPGDYDVLLMSYGIWRNESKKFRKDFFDVAFFDELQIAKNHVSQIYSALLQVQSRVKIGLTGTPIENQLRELKSLFDLVLPGYMPDDVDFREFFVKPIEKDDSPERRQLLARFVRPFVLRRRKQDVLPELPDKTEDISYAELIGEQKSLYRTVAAQQALPIIQLLKDDSAPIPYMHIFALLAALKQICNHPAAYLRDVANYERYESGKWEAFVELLEEAAESNQKVVVFSQYLAMLDIIEAHLTKNKINFAQIRGQTRLRGDEVERFHNDPNCRVFLGSLQAAGLGIDLTPASVVIHYDRWWNAARENQATDRVHRIGQTRGVQVFKLMTKNTIEEKIDLMIQRKQNLLEDIVAVDDHQVMKRLTRGEILNLLESLSNDNDQDK
jgi:superfamily II DNA or RNA helicase